MFDSVSERCYDCDGHFRHFPGCHEYTGEPALSLEQRLAVFTLVKEVSA
jgi:hypothetical protein